jgi:hypothetical protein
MMESDRLDNGVRQTPDSYEIGAHLSLRDPNKFSLRFIQRAMLSAYACHYRAIGISEICCQYELSAIMQ